MRVKFLAVLGLLGCGLAPACASSGAVPRPFPTPMEAGPRLPAPDTAERRLETADLVGTALALRGVRYRNGGSDPSGFDCSGFVWYVFARHGIAVPRTVAGQFGAGRPVPVSDLQAGDLVFFDTAGRPASHVGVVVDGRAFVHAPSSRGSVRMEDLGSRYWLNHFVGARRLR
jgi:cell wall-associated NlpC family hydrolase